MNKFDQECKEKHEGGKCQGAGADCDTAGTGFALLPFLGDGQTHTQGEYQEQVRKGLKWLMDHQKGDGDLYTGGNANSHLYSHGVATIALCEAYALTDDQKVKHHAQRAIDFIVASQNKTSGGWRYKPGEDGDTSVLGWQVMALKSGQMGGLNVPEQTIELAKKWIDRVSGTGDKFGQFGYTSSNDTKLAMTGEALLVLQYMGTDRNDPRLIAGAEFLLKNKPQRNVETSYYWYYGTQFMYHMQGRYWKEWNTNMSSAVLQEQVAKDGQLGSWTPKDQWEGQGGRIYSTALRVLMLEVYYRHLPLYQLIDE
ncbi:MAG: prenyltransferase beta subunit [Pirellulaceae bacterium]